jgi:ubiquinone/menaquinone biosynthesis C-methylase UbiE
MGLRRISPGIFAALLAGLLLCFLPHRSEAQAPQRPTSTPYRGDLSIFETPGRDERLQIQRVMDLLGIQHGSRVADLGAGSGWFTARAAARVGAAGTVFAEDINPDAIRYIDARIEKEKLGNVKTVLGTPDDPKLPPQSVDAVLLLKVYHEIARPQALLANLKPALKPGAKIGIIDRNGDGADHGLNEDVVKREMKAAGFKVVGAHDFTKADGQDYFLVFQARQ